jgi:hypothetical protein
MKAVKLPHTERLVASIAPYPDFPFAFFVVKYYKKEIFHIEGRA